MLQIIKASAGSGKTYTLALEYITLLLGVKDGNGNYRLAEDDFREYHRHILAVTFTNKATEEMKERIIKELAVLAGRWGDGKSQYLATLCQRFGVDDENRVRRAADRALGELLFDFTNFNVSTIDSFFQIILRTFAGEIDVPYDYNIELNEKYAMQVGIRDFLSRLRRNGAIAGNAVVGWLEKYVGEKVNDGSSWNIFSSISSRQGAGSTGSGDLFNFASVINTEQYRKASMAMSNYFNEGNGGNVGKLQIAVNRLAAGVKEDIIDKAKGALRIVHDRGLGEYLAARGTAAMLARFASGDIADKDSTDREKTFLYLSQPEKVIKTVKKNPALREEVIREISPLLDAMNQSYADHLLLMHINRHIYMLGLLGGISGSVGQYRKDNNLILLSDTNELLNDIISEDDTPFIYERIGVWINNFLVDEFQDTSALQWQNFKPLLSNSLAYDNDNLIIGDEKQCIYRFRNSDPSLLQYKVIEQFRDKNLKVSGDKSTNWRSTPQVVMFNNMFFTMAAKRLGVEDVYANVVQKPNVKPRNVSGYVRVELVDCSDAVSDDGEPVEIKFTEKVLERLPSELSAMLARGYKQSDIAILVNTNTEGAMVIKRLLEYNLEAGAMHNFKVISSDSLLLKNSPTVRLIISHLRYLGVAVELRDGQKTDRRELEEKIHRLLRLYENHLNAGCTPEVAMEKAMTSPVSKEDMLGEIDEFIPRDCQCHNLVSVVERIIEKAVSPEARERENPFISALQDYVIEFSSRLLPSIRSFVDWWDRNCDKLSITSPAGVDAINVMTIHKSKGLEYPCVVIPFANWEMCRVEDTVWFTRDEVLQTGLFDTADSNAVPPLVPVKRDGHIASSRLGDAYMTRVKESLIDSLNKTYVAFTRAIDELHIFAEMPEKSVPGVEAMTLADYLWEYGNDASLPEIAERLNHENGTDVAVSITKTSTGYETGSVAGNDREPARGEPITAMLPYFVVNRHNLARFDLPEVFYTARQERGILLHRILGMIHNDSEVERCLKYCKVRCVVLPGQYEEVCNLIRSMLVQNDEVKRWFARGNRVYKERTISADGKNYRPDRVVVTPEGETIVIDFKFGEKHEPHYKKQVKHYMELVAAAGLPRVTGRIWYPLEGVIEVVE